MSTGPTLEQAIEQQISLGVKDPHLVYDALERHLGDELAEIARPYLADFIAEMARQKINADRRASIAKINTKTAVDPEVKLKSLWVPSAGTIIYKRIADMTADDFDARADYLDRMANGIHRHAQWCRDCAQEIRDHGVKTAGKLAHLPALRDDEDL